MSEYELQRLANIQRNNDQLKRFNLPELSTSFHSEFGKKRGGKRKLTRKEKLPRERIERPSRACVRTSMPVDVIPMTDSDSHSDRDLEEDQGGEVGGLKKSLLGSYPHWDMQSLDKTVAALQKHGVQLPDLELGLVDEAFATAIGIDMLSFRKLSCVWKKPVEPSVRQFDRDCRAPRLDIARGQVNTFVRKEAIELVGKGQRWEDVAESPEVRLCSITSDIHGVQACDITNLLFVL